MKNNFIVNTNLFEAFFFDMDGLLLNTEKLCWECFKETCLKYGYDPDFSIYKNCIGRGGSEGNVILRKGFAEFIPYDEVNRKWNMLYRNKIENEAIDIKEGVTGILEYLRSKDAYIAVVTSTETQLALIKLNNSGLKDFFCEVTGGDQVEISKPDPRIYLKAAEKANADPAKCIAFEDSDNGVISARNAGMTVVQIPDMIEPSEDNRKLGHVIAGSFNDLIIV